jgi:hypothetical protein
MAAIGGSIESISLGGREFPVAGDAEVQRKLGGFENEQMVNGNGTTRLIKNRVAWALSGVAIEMDDSRSDHEYVQGLADSNENFAIVITYASGIVYQGDGQFTGELQSSSQNATMPVTLNGPGVLSQQ